MPTKAVSGAITVRGIEYEWHVHRVGGSSSAYDNYRGLAIAVVLAAGRTKELRVEFPFKEYGYKLPTPKAAFERRLEAIVVEALDAGWEPESRGKPFVYQVENAV
jgi:hypothetical protein